MPYAMVDKEDGGIGGGIGQAPDGNGHVTFYVGTDDPQATLDKAEQLGGKTILPVTELPEVDDRAVRRSRRACRRARQGDVV